VGKCVERYVVVGIGFPKIIGGYFQIMGCLFGNGLLILEKLCVFQCIDLVILLHDFFGFFCAEGAEKSQ
jgi:uncharacterized membrane protein